MKAASLFRFLYARYWPVIWGGLLLLGLAWGWRSCTRPADDHNWQLVKPFGIRLPMSYTVHGIDVSHHNRRINWKRVRAMQADGVRLRFAFLKATEGATHTDREFALNWREARKAGMRRGAYHFYHPRRDARKQADNYIRRVTLQPGDFVPVLDVEIERGLPTDEMVAGIRVWLERIEAHYGVRPMIYTNAHIYKKYIAKPFADYPLWIADYSNPTLARYPANRLYIWQHNETGRVEGVHGHVDFNVFTRAPEQISEICL
jgi:lysozyme